MDNSDFSSDQSSSDEEIIVEEAFRCKLCPNSKFTKEEINNHRNHHIQAGEWPPKRQRPSSPAPSTLIRPFPKTGDNNQADRIPRSLRRRAKTPKPNEAGGNKVTEKNKGAKGKGRATRREREKIKTVKSYNKDVKFKRFIPA